MQVNCPTCHRPVIIGPEYLGKAVACPHCGQKMIAGPSSSPPFQTPPVEPVVSPPVIQSSRDSYRGRSMQASPSLLDLFDWKFEKYITPWVVRITWIWVGVMACLLIVTMLLPEGVSNTPKFTVERPFSNFDKSESRDSSSPEIVRGIVYRIGSITGVLMLLLWIRVWLECVIVIFNIAATMKAAEASIKVIESVARASRNT